MLAQKRELQHEPEASEANCAGSSEDEKEDDHVKLQASSRRMQKQQERDHVQIVTRRASLEAVPEQRDVASQAKVPKAEGHQVCIRLFFSAGMNGFFFFVVHFWFWRHPVWSLSLGADECVLACL
jgi:hypothetical protein